MEIFGVGPMEFVYILLIILLVFGPNDIAKGARSLGSLINRWRKSDDFHLVKQVVREVRELPNRLAEETGLDEINRSHLELPKEAAAAPRAEIAQLDSPSALKEEGSQP
jgi:Sec-independent protein translocase protein TatA